MLSFSYLSSYAQFFKKTVHNKGNDCYEVNYCWKMKHSQKMKFSQRHWLRTSPFECQKKFFLVVLEVIRTSTSNGSVRTPSETQMFKTSRWWKHVNKWEVLSKLNLQEGISCWFWCTIINMSHVFRNYFGYIFIVSFGHLYSTC